MVNVRAQGSGVADQSGRQRTQICDYKSAVRRECTSNEDVQPGQHDAMCFRNARLPASASGRNTHLYACEQPQNIPPLTISASGRIASFPSLSSQLHRRANLGAGASAVSGMVKKRTPFNVNALLLRYTRRLAAAMNLSAMSCAGTKAGGARSSAGPSSMAVETTSNAPTSMAPADASAPPAQAGK